MGKIKDIFTGEHRAFAWFVVVVTALFVFLWTVGPGKTIIKWVETAMEINSMEKRMETLNQEIDEMDQNIEELKTNRDSLEKFAREHFNFAVPGEDVYVIE